MNDTAKKCGLIYSSDFKCIFGIDTDSSEFRGTVPGGAVRIEEDAFSCCELTEIILPDSVQETGANLFCNSTKLEHVKLPSGLKQLSPFMFCGCSSLKKVDMPLEVEDFPEGLFADCSSLEEIPFRAGIKNLPEGVFSGCSSITSLVIPETVEKIAADSITGCTKLRTIVLPASLKEFEDGAIKDCPSISRIRISDDNNLFFTDEEGTVLYRRKADGTGVPVFQVTDRVQSEIPTFSEIDEEENPSIISYENEEEESDEESILFQKEEEDGPEISGNDESENGGSDDEVTDVSPLEDISDENIIQDKEETKVMSDENTTLTSDMEARLREIMGQEKQYGEGEFTIMDIPEASEEEIQANILEASGEHPDFERTMEIPLPMKPVPASESDEPEKSMEEKIAEIIEQNQGQPGFSIMDIPAASQREIEEDRIVSEGDFAAGVEDDEAEIPEIPEAQLKATEALYEDDEKAVMHNLFFEAKKVEQINLDYEAVEQNILYVFAQELANGQFGKIFSKRLVKCANRLAQIHKYSSIFFFSGVNLDNEKFKNQFTRYMEDKNVLIACSAGTLGTLDEHTKIFAACAHVPLDKEKMDEQVRLARSSEPCCLKLLIQDNLAE